VLVQQRLAPADPWLTRDAVRFLGSTLRPVDRMLEWGSGRSTIWFAQRVEQLTSVEHDEAWYRRTQAEVTAAGMTNVRLLLKESRRDDYVGVATTFEPESLGCVLIDGVPELRDACALAAVPLVQRAGLLVIDNANWYLPSPSRAPSSRARSDGPASAQWTEFQRRVADWRVYWTSNGVWDTAIWVRA
jgi:predicted O-methyltransferase YrrM